MSDLANLQAIKSGYIQTLADESAYQVAHGPKPSYSADGRSVSWDEWRSMMLEKIQELNRLIQLESSPFQIISRMTG